MCLEHISAIKHKIGIEGVLTEAVSWSCTGNPEKGVCGSQVDLLTVRKDRVTNPVCRCFLLFWGSHFIPASGVHNPWNVKTAGGSEETTMPAVIMSYKPRKISSRVFPRRFLRQFSMGPSGMQMSVCFAAALRTPEEGHSSFGCFRHVFPETGGRIPGCPT